MADLQARQTTEFVLACVFLIVVTVTILGCVAMARKKGLNPVLAGLLGLFLSFIGLLIVAIIPGPSQRGKEE